MSDGGHGETGTGNESSGASIGRGRALRRIDFVKRVLDLELEEGVVSGD